MTTNLQVLVVTRGHAFAHDAFLAMLEALPNIDATLVQMPAAIEVLAAGTAERWQAVLFYDMSGIPGIGATHDLADATGQPDPLFRSGIEALLARGTGIVMLNHATVSWPHWPRWREIHGSSFMLAAGLLNGEETPGSGYRGGHGPLANATCHMAPVGTHPVLMGLEAGFELTDELYLKGAAFEEHVLPLLRADYDFVAENSTPPPLASAEEQAQWSHAPGSNLVAWANRCEASPVIASDLGDSPNAYDNDGLRESRVPAPARQRPALGGLRGSTGLGGRSNLKPGGWVQNAETLSSQEVDRCSGRKVPLNSQRASALANSPQKTSCAAPCSVSKRPTAP